MQVFQAALGFLNGKQVEQGLCRMLVRTVTGVDHRHLTGKLRHQPRGPFLRVAHHDGIRVLTDHAHGVRQGFAFFAQRGVTAV